MVYAYLINYCLSLLLSPINASIIYVTIDSKILNQKAAHQFCTLKPCTNEAANLIIIVLIISKNSPNVSTVMGMVNIINIGLTNVFSNASTSAITIAVIPLLIVTPGSR